MNNEFSKRDLVSFGNFLLSKEREKSFEGNPNYPDKESIQDRLSEVNHSDIENWLFEEEKS